MLVIGWIPLCATQADLRSGGHRLCSEIRKALDARAVRFGVGNPTSDEDY